MNLVTIDELIQRQEDAVARAQGNLDVARAKAEDMSAALKRGSKIRPEVVEEAAVNMRQAARLLKREEDVLEEHRRNKIEDQRIAELQRRTVPVESRVHGAGSFSARGYGSAYTEFDAEAGQASFLMDLFRSQIKLDPAAGQRLAEHGRSQQLKERATVTGDVAGFVPPGYMTDLFAEFARAGRPAANLLTTMNLPKTGMSIVVPKVTTESIVALQATQGTSIANQNVEDTPINVPILTVGGYVTVSRQALERGELVEQVVLNDLASAYATALDAKVVEALAAQTSVNTETYTSTSPSVAELWPHLASAAGKIRSQRFTGGTAWVMHPRRWAWMQAALDKDDRPLLGAEGTSVNPVAVQTNTQYGGAVGSLLGLPVVVDANLATNLGAGTNQDEIYVADFRDSILFEDSAVPTQLKFEADGGTTLSVNLVAYGYFGVTFARQPKSITKISGTGLVAPA